MRRVQRGAFASPLLGSQLDKHALSKQDKALITELIYGSLRHQRYLEHCLAPLLKRPDKLPDSVYISLLLATYELLIRQTPRHAAIHSWVEVVKQQTRKLAGLTNAVLRRVKAIDTAEAVRFSVPDWLYQNWQDLFKDQAPSVATGMQKSEPLWVYSYHPNSEKQLAEEGCEVTKGPLADTLALRCIKSVSALTSFQKGWIQPQNPASTLPVRILLADFFESKEHINPIKGKPVLDLASGNGIKAAQLAAYGLKVTSVELAAKKIARAKENLTRLNLSIKHLQHDLNNALELPPFPYLLLDAPCSGTGTLRGNPEIRQRLKQEDLQTLVALQQRMLEQAAKLTAVKGQLVYAVCALTEAEGEQQIRHFLAKHPSFITIPIDTSLPHIKTSTGLYTLPVEGLDGFFIAKLERMT